MGLAVGPTTAHDPSRPSATVGVRILIQQHPRLSVADGRGWSWELCCSTVSATIGRRRSQVVVGQSCSFLLQYSIRDHWSQAVVGGRGSVM
jgi:hypothetical protein